MHKEDNVYLSEGGEGGEMGLMTPGGRRRAGGRKEKKGDLRNWHIRYKAWCQCLTSARERVYEGVGHT